MAKELDEVRLLVPVSGISEAENQKVSFPAGTEGIILDVNGSSHLIEIGWQTSPVSNDGLLITLEPDQFEVVKEYKSEN